MNTLVELNTLHSVSELDFTKPLETNSSYSLEDSSTTFSDQENSAWATNRLVYSELDQKTSKHSSTTSNPTEIHIPVRESHHFKKSEKLYDYTDIYSYIDPHPVGPPDYTEANPSKRVTFPVYEYQTVCSLNEKPPLYTPAIQHATIVSMKQEWKSPYDISPARNWVNLIMEINSTQLNFYKVDNSLTKQIKGYGNGELKDDNGLSLSDNPFQIFSSKKAYTLDKKEHYSIMQKLSGNEIKYLTNENMFKSFSLQYSILGIPTDYKKRTFVLRLRCEDHQFLLKFCSVDDLLSWATYINMGASVSLDLDVRELPNYRVVPRRRRHRRRRMKRKTRHRVSSVKTKNSDNGKKQYNQIAANLGPFLGKSVSLPELPKKKINNDKNRRFSSAETSSNSTFKLKIKNFFKSNKKTQHSSFSMINSNTDPSPHQLFAVVEEDEVNGSEMESHLAKFECKYVGKPLLATSEDSNLKSQHDHNLLDSNMDNIIAVSRINTVNTEITIELQNEEQIPFPTISRGSLFENMENIHDQNELNKGFDQAYQTSTPNFCGNVEEEEEEVYEAYDGIVIQGNDIEEDFPEEDEDLDIRESIYADEGILHDSEDDYEYVYIDEFTQSRRRRTLSRVCAMSCAQYVDDDVKWSPPLKIMSRKRFIRDSLRCIKGLADDKTWLGETVYRPAVALNFKTNNLPMYIGQNCNQKRFNTTNPSKIPLNTQMRNYYLKSYIVGPVGFLHFSNNRTI